MAVSFDGVPGDFFLTYALDQMGEISRGVRRAGEKLAILEAALDQVALGTVADQETPDGSYGYIPIAVSEFLNCLFDLETALADDSDYADPDLRHRRVDFIEAGCGPGRNVFLALATDRFELRKVHGLDISAPLIEQGRRAFGLGEAVFVADCASFDYAPYDVVYFYRPFADPAAEEAFERHVVASARPGAYLIGCGQITFDDDRRLLRKDDTGRVFKKLR